MTIETACVLIIIAVFGAAALVLYGISKIIEKLN